MQNYKQEQQIDMNNNNIAAIRQQTRTQCTTTNPNLGIIWKQYEQV